MAFFVGRFNPFTLMNPFHPDVTRFGHEFEAITGRGCPLEIRVIVNAFVVPGTPSESEGENEDAEDEEEESEEEQFVEVMG